MLEALYQCLRPQNPRRGLRPRSLRAASEPLQERQVGLAEAHGPPTLVLSIHIVERPHNHSIEVTGPAPGGTSKEPDGVDGCQTTTKRRLHVVVEDE